MRTEYTLRVEWPETIDGDTAAEILDDADDQDVTLEAQVRRWLSRWIDDAARSVSESLPEGWYAKVDDYD